MKHLKMLLLSASSFVLMSCGGGAAKESKSVSEKIKVLIVTGQNNHNWQVSHVAMKQILENSGLFSVDVATSPQEGEDMSEFVVDFSPYQLVIVDYNGDMWPEKTRSGFEAYANNGGGIIIYHAADNAFPEWEAYNEICALGGWNGRNEKSGPYVYLKDGQIVKDSSQGVGGAHGTQHEYVLNLFDSGHPITEGLPQRWMHAKDELYDQMRGPGNIKSLLYSAYADPKENGSGRDEPLLFTVDYKGARVFHTMLGHVGKSLEDNPAMQCIGFQLTLLRGAEWAATGKVTQAVPADFPSEEKVTYRLRYKVE